MGQSVDCIVHSPKALRSDLQVAFRHTEKRQPTIHNPRGPRQQR